jgi:hypothetical protein
MITLLNANVIPSSTIFWRRMAQPRSSTSVPRGVLGQASRSSGILSSCNRRRWD